MARRRVKLLDDGSVNLRMDIPPQLWQLASQLAKQWRVKPEQALGIFLEKLSHIIDAGKASIFGDDIAFAYNKLLINDEINVGGLPPIDVTKLHLSNKTKSGFVGVYANGKGFRAIGKAPGIGTGTVSIGTFPTAEQAAQARLLHHKKFKLPYGELEERLTYWRGKYPEMSDADLVSLLDPISFNEKPLGELFAEAGIVPSEEPPQGTKKFEPIGGVDPALFGHD